MDEKLYVIAEELSEDLTDESIEDVDEVEEIVKEDGYDLSNEINKNMDQFNEGQEEIKDYHGQFDHILCNRKIGVYVKTDDEGFITDIDSDIFIDNLDGWLKIDEGEGDRFAHAQSQYYDMPLIDEFGHYKYKLK